ncbi:MAG: response regulator, partial [Fusobacteriota bacterium]
NNGVETIMASDGRRAVEILKEKEFDVIFMDIQMPIMNGFEATKKIKEMDERKDIPIIAMTAHATEEDRKLCLRKGMDDYISKPIKSEDISKVIEKYLNN